LYYIPAPGKKAALYRDWVIMTICRRFFDRVVLHWHAAGLGQWLETSQGDFGRHTTFRCLGRADLSIVLSDFNRRDAEKLQAQQVRVVHNGIPDPCPAYAETIRPVRRMRVEAQRKLLLGGWLSPAERRAAGGDPETVRVLYLAHCIAAKGLFDACEGVLLVNRDMRAAGIPLTFKLTIAGGFMDPAERRRFDDLLKTAEGQNVLNYIGFVNEEAKAQALRAADIFCFPTYYDSENQPVSLLEAMAFGLPILTTRWRSLPELLPPGYPGLVEVKSPSHIARGLKDLLTVTVADDLRRLFESRFTIQAHVRSLAVALHSVAPEVIKK
jgi:glycosyltransferase involved in cell wall biosynthesis